MQQPADIDTTKYSEDDLLQLAQTGDDEAFARLMLKLEEPVRRFIRRLLGTTSAEDDIVQDVFINLYHKMHYIKPEQGIRPYLYRMVRNRCYDELRRQGRYEMLSLDDEPVEAYASFNTPVAEAPEEIAHWLMIQLEVRDAMDRLPELQRQALILYAEEEMSYAEIADAMETSIGTIKSRLYHAKQNLRRWMRPETLSALDISLDSD